MGRNAGRVETALGVLSGVQGFVVLAGDMGCGEC